MTVSTVLYVLAAVAFALGGFEVLPHDPALFAGLALFATAHLPFRK